MPADGAASDVASDYALRLAAAGGDADALQAGDAASDASLRASYAALLADDDRGDAASSPDAFTPPAAAIAAAVARALDVRVAPAFAAEHAAGAATATAADFAALCRFVGAMASSTRSYDTDRMSDARAGLSPAALSGPFGQRAVVYADWTASGRPHRAVERHVRRRVLPLYGNTHTTTSATGQQSMWFRAEARQLVAQAANAHITGKAAKDVVLFAGAGATGAALKLCEILGLRHPLRAPEPDPLRRPVVFVGPFEHHSNLLPWREGCADVVQVPLGRDGRLCQTALAAALAAAAGRPLLLGSFAAASNVTGVREAVDAVTALLHKHGALAAWDYATAASHGKVDMNPLALGVEGDCAKDAVYISTHKLVGGVGGAGVLVVKKRLCGNAVPGAPSGGTVFYATAEDHRYLSTREEREEGGTPDILGAVRAGLAFQLLAHVGADAVAAREAALFAKAGAALSAMPNVVLLGGAGGDAPGSPGRLPIFPFLVRYGGPDSGRYLHYHYVCALLNDVFGVQVRGGCSCAGPYSQHLMGLDSAKNRRFEAALLAKQEVLRPGYTRLSLSYAMSDAHVDLCLAAIAFVAQRGWEMLPAYRYNHRTGEWRHVSRFTRAPHRLWLSAIDWRADASDGGESDDGGDGDGDGDGDDDSAPDDVLAEAARLADAARERFGRGTEISRADAIDAEHEALRWFVYPDEAAAQLKGAAVPAAGACVIVPAAVLGATPDQLRAREAAAAAAPPPPASKKHPARAADARPPEAPAFVAAGAVAAAVAVAVAAPVAVAVAAAAAAPAAVVAVAVAAPVDTLPSPDDADADPAAAPAAKKKPKRIVPPSKVMKLVGAAIRDWSMIQDGDRVLVGLSGGKDSLTMLFALMDLQRRAPINFTLAAATVDPMTPSFDPSPLRDYMASLGVPYYYLSDRIIDRATCSLQGDSLCSFCSRFKRGLLYTCCRNKNFNKLALGQHLDDMAESMFMSCMHNGQVRTMKAAYREAKGDVDVIRPLAYVRETQTRDFATAAKLPIINENCPACFEQPKERERVKKMLSKEESLNPSLFTNLRRAMLPLMHGRCYEAFKTIRDEIESRPQRGYKGGSSKGAGAGAGEAGVEAEE